MIFRYSLNDETRIKNSYTEYHFKDAKQPTLPLDIAPPTTMQWQKKIPALNSLFLHLRLYRPHNLHTQEVTIISVLIQDIGYYRYAIVYTRI